MKRLASLDLLRGLAAFSVATSHYLVLSSVAENVAEVISVLSVEVFFVLSGFVLAPQILFCVRRGRPADLWIFLVRRWMRTIPPYVFALLIISVFFGQVLSGDFLRYLLYVQNLFFQANSRDYFPVAWSLSIEEWFYVSFPLILVVFSRSVRRADVRFCFVAACCFIAAITLIRSIFGNFEDWGFEVRRVVLFRIDSIAYGFLLYLLVGKRAPDREATAPPYGTLVLATLALVATALVAFSAASAIASRGHHASEYLFPFLAAGFGMSAVFLLYALGRMLGKNAAVAAFCSYLGKISYSIYLFHVLIAMLLRPAFGGLPLHGQLAIYVAAIVAFCSVFYYCFERPILAARPDYAPVDHVRPVDKPKVSGAWRGRWLGGEG